MCRVGWDVHPSSPSCHRRARSRRGPQQNEAPSLRRVQAAPIPAPGETCQTCLFMTGTDQALPPHLQHTNAACAALPACLAHLFVVCVSAKADSSMMPPSSFPPLGGGSSSLKLHRGRWVKLLSALLALCHAWRHKPNVSDHGVQHFSP